MTVTPLPASGSQLPASRSPLPAGESMDDRAAERRGIGRTIRGLRQYRHLLRNLVAKDLKLKYRGSVFGFVWSLANPLIMIAVYTVAFTQILQLRTPMFVFYLMLGVLAWTFFAGAIAMSTGSLVDNGGLVRAVWFPRAILPIATVLFNFSQYLLTAIVFIPIMLAIYQVAPAAPMLAFPLFLLLQLALTIGLALLVSVGTAFFRDIRHFVDVGLAMLFWATPVVYETTQLPDRLRQAILLTPLSPYITAYHDVFYYRQWPAAEVWILAIVYAAIALAAGLWVISRVEDRLTEQV